ncbi:modular serine protease-like [Drosophila innubila]|uniref:modular serine protease-like n=1 Tax=Drosophila innubila TaxID=198719 RepID=UPI00148CDFDB|nr:modular serine protease-like [Drosophila innubila]
MPKMFSYKVFGICLILQYLQSADAAAMKQNCYEGQFQCKNGECISADLKCNAKLDCTDGSDETFEHCYQSKCLKHRCAYGGCFEDSQHCDGKIDCIDGTDENEFTCANSTKMAELLNNKIRGECRDKPYTQYQCQQSKECISYSQVCDGVEQCRDKSDESIELCAANSCPEGSFRCAYGACIAISAACNHAIDCRDESDEVTSICKSWHNLSSDANWEISQWKITPAIDTHAPESAIPMAGNKAAAQPLSEEKSCIVPTDDKAVKLRTMFNGSPYYEGNDVTHLTTIGLGCSPKHILKGTEVNTCDNGKWKAPWPKCVRFCDRNQITNDPKINVICRYRNKIFDCFNEPAIVNTIAEITCAPGYIPEGNVAKSDRVCSSDGSWRRLDAKSSRLKCKPDCGKTFSTVEGYPWVVSIYRHTSNSNFRFSCLGAIIDPFFVLTAASCFSPSPVPHTTQVVLGNHSIGFNSAKEHGFDTFNIANIDVEEFKPFALLKMVNPFTLSAKVRPICLQNFSGNTSQDPVEPWRVLGEPLVYLDPKTNTFNLTHIVENDKRLTFNIKNEIVNEIKQNDYLLVN